MTDQLEKLLSFVNQAVEKAGEHAPEVWQTLVLYHQVMQASWALFAGVGLFVTVWLYQRFTKTIWPRERWTENESLLIVFCTSVGLVVSAMFGAMLIDKLPGVFVPEASLILSVIR